MARRKSRVNRRGFLVAGALTGFGLNLGDFFSLRAAQAATNEFVAPEAKAKSVIHIFLPGGLSAQESWDPKPLAPIEYRGEVGAIDTVIPGVKFSELMPQLAKIADKLTVIRSLTHGEAAHERGQHNMLTGYRPNPALVYPSMGSVVGHEFGPRKNLPPYICVPNAPSEYAGPGYLSTAYAPFSVGGAPENPNFRVQDLSAPGFVDDDRYHRRMAALSAVNADFVEETASDAVAAMDEFYNRAFDLIGSKPAQEAFNLNAEPGNVRDRYGRNAAGQRMLLARRLVEAGARFVSLTYGGWDHHARITQGMRSQTPALDRGLAALISDLDERGLLDETLVLVSSEFGRTPKVNQDAGRDHWSKVFSVAMAGGGTKRGAVIGSSGATSIEPEDTPISPEDLAATVYHQLGIAPGKELMAPGNRPIEIIKDGAVREELIA